MNRTLALRIATVLVICALFAGLLYFTPRLAPPTAKTYELVLHNEAPPAPNAYGASLITVNQGDTVTLHIKAGRGGQIMIHGYEQELTGHEKELTVGDGDETTLTFVASKSGRYMVHLHREGEHLEVAQIDVQPR